MNLGIINMQQPSKRAVSIRTEHPQTERHCSAWNATDGSRRLQVPMQSVPTMHNRDTAPNQTCGKKPLRACFGSKMTHISASSHATARSGPRRHHISWARVHQIEPCTRNRVMRLTKKTLLGTHPLATPADIRTTTRSVSGHASYHARLTDYQRTNSPGDPTLQAVVREPAR